MKQRLPLRKAHWTYVLGIAGATLGVLSPSAAHSKDEPARASAAIAPPTSTGTLESARGLFRQASRLARAERWVEAIAHYRQAFDLFPHATTLYNVGYCYERLADYAAALRYTAAALEISEDRPQHALDTERIALAKAALVTLSAQVAEVALDVEAVRVILHVDGQPLSGFDYSGERRLFVGSSPGSASSSPGGATLILNPGRHALLFQAATGLATEYLELPPGSRVAWSAPSSRARAAADETPAATPHRLGREAVASTSAHRVAAVHRSVRDRPRSLQRTLGVGSLLLGGGAAAVGLGAGALAMVTRSRLNERCDAAGRCPASESAAVSRYHDSAAISTLGIAVAAAAGAAGVTLLLLEAQSRSTHVQLRFSPSSQLMVHGRF
jgi:hypothetical protein